MILLDSLLISPNNRLIPDGYIDARAQTLFYKLFLCLTVASSLFVESNDNYLTRLLKKLENHLGKTLSEIAGDTVFENTLLNSDGIIASDSWKFSCFMYHILLNIHHGIETEQFHSQNRRFLQNYIKTLSTVSVYGLTSYLQSDLLKHPCFKTSLIKEPEDSSQNNKRLGVSVSIFSKLIQNKLLQQNAQIDHILLQLLAGIFTLICDDQTKEAQKFQQFLDGLYKMNGEKFIKLLLILKSIKDQPLEMKKIIHKDLLERLKTPGGFKNLCKNILQSQSDSTGEPTWKRVEIIANIVGHKGHSMSFYKFIVDEIYSDLISSLGKSNESIYVTACIGCLSKIYNLPNETVHRQIELKFFKLFNEFHEPNVILTGSIILDDQELRQLFQIIFLAFCTSGPAALPSKLLIPYLPQLMHFFSQFSAVNLEIPKQQIASIIVQCLANRERNELKSIVRSLISDEYPIEMKRLHPRVHVKQNANKCSIQIVSENDRQDYDAAQVLLQILKQSKHNILIYNVFINLLEFLIDFIDVRHQQLPSAADLIDEITDFTALMQKSFKKQIAIVYTLSELINFKSFHCQFRENPDEIMNLFQNILIGKIEQLKKQLSPPGEDKEMMILILSIVREFVTELKDKKD